MRYLLLLLLIACQPEPVEPPNKLTYVRWYSVSNPNYYFSLMDYDPCNPLYGSCKDLYWLDVNDNKFVAKIMSGLNNKYKR